MEKRRRKEEGKRLWMGEERKRERKTKPLPLSPRGLAALSVREGESYYKRRPKRRRNRRFPIYALKKLLAEGIPKGVIQQAYVR